MAALTSRNPTVVSG
jgi:hypothetical protein